jgi:hypothetical protein
MHKTEQPICAYIQFLTNTLDKSIKMCYTYDIRKGVVHCFGNVYVSSRQPLQTLGAYRYPKDKNETFSVSDTLKVFFCFGSSLFG